jgi:hypothetical protein
MPVEVAEGLHVHEAVDRLAERLPASRNGLADEVVDLFPAVGRQGPRITSLLCDVSVTSCCVKVLKTGSTWSMAYELSLKTMHVVLSSENCSLNEKPRPEKKSTVLRRSFTGRLTNVAGDIVPPFSLRHSSTPGRDDAGVRRPDARAPGPRE